MTIDWSILINWIISGLIGLIFGIAGAWATHRLDRKRDDITWEREKQKLEDNWQHEKELLEIQFKQKLAEIESQRLYEEKKKIREELLKGLDIVSIRSKELQNIRLSMAKERDVVFEKMYVRQAQEIGQGQLVDKEEVELGIELLEQMKVIRSKDNLSRFLDQMAREAENEQARLRSLLKYFELENTENTQQSAEK